MMDFDFGQLWTILPLRGFAAGKSRLAPALDAAGRALLNRELLARTLDVIEQWSGTLDRTVVVSSCASVLALAGQAGAAVVRDGAPALGQSGAVRQGAAHAVRHRATHILALPNDLPLLSVEALRALTDAAGPGRVVLAPDQAGTGTNAVLVAVGAGFEFAFGAGSFPAHRAAAERCGLEITVVRRAELQFDLDTPEDLERWRRTRSTSQGFR